MHILLALIFSLSLHASTEWRLNDDHSEFFFQVDYLEVGHVTGRFLKFESTAVFKDNEELESVRFTIDPRSIDTANRQRDQHLRAHDFLYTHKHPDILFESTKIQKESSESFLISGDLTLRGITRPNVLTVSISKTKKDSWEHAHKFVQFKSKLNREDFNIRWNKTLPDSKYLIGQTITFWGNLQLQPSGALTPTSKHLIPDTPGIRAREKLNRDEINLETYQKAVGLTGNGSSPRATKIPAVKIETVSNKVVLNDTSHSTWWTLWLLVLGFFGFLGSIWASIEIKKFTSLKLREKYAENGLWGHMSDVMTLTLTLLFGFAFWVVGWGQ